MLGPLEVPAPGLQGLAVGGLLWAHGTPLALALGVTVTAGSPPFSVPAFWKVGARPRVVQASFGPAAASGRSVLRKAWCRSPRAAVTLVTSPWRLVGPVGRELSAQLALGAGAWPVRSLQGPGFSITPPTVPCHSYLKELLHIWHLGRKSGCLFLWQDL